MTWKLFTLAALIGLAGCSTSNVTGGSSAPRAASPSGTASASASGGMVSGNPDQAGECDSARVQNAVGSSLTQASLDTLRQQSGAASARTLKPGEMITMEYNPARLNVLIDAKNTVTAVRCG